MTPLFHEKAPYDSISQKRVVQPTIGIRKRPMKAMPSKAAQQTIDIRRSQERFHTKIDWLDSWHSFSFADHYDSTNTHHGLLLVSNDDTVRANAGFGTHAHQDMEIVTWVLEGELEHKD